MPGTKGRYLLGEAAATVIAKLFDPVPQGFAGGIEQATEFIAGELPCERHRRKAGTVENLVGVGVADAAKKARIGKRTFQRMIGGCHGRPEGFVADLEHIESAGVV